jgi:hypothetical protein
MSWSEMQRREDGQRIESPAFVPGEDFDPLDPEEVEIVKLATSIHAAETIDHLRAECARLQSVINENFD